MQKQRELYFYMSENKTVYFRNPKRNVPENSNIFIPAHKKANIDPTKHKNNANNIAKTNNSARLPGNPYDVSNEVYNTLSMTSGLPKSVFIDPNAETFASVDNDIDFDNIEVPNNIMHPPINNISSNNEIDKRIDSNIDDILVSIEDGSYILLVEGAAICSGPLNLIEDEVSALIYGQHELCDGEPINPNSICVFKKMSIKVGAFLE